MKLISSVPFTTVLLFMSVGAVAAQSPPRTIEVEEPIPHSIETYQLENGLTVVLSPDHSVPVAALNLWYHVGSANEDPGRTGFAHLFEHMMFQGSENVGDDAHFRYVEEAGGTLNGSTNNDRTNYYQAFPSNFLEQMIWLEADRMGGLLPAITQEKLDNQRSVVQNERRQRYENAPYGLASETLAGALYPPGHPYSWSVIGSMADLNAASLEDVSSFFRRYYAPGNASLAIVGDFDPEDARRWIERYFGPIPAGPPIVRPDPEPVMLAEEKRIVLEDRVQLPRLYISWHSPALYAPGDAEMDILATVLAGGQSSRLHRRMVFDEQVAQFVSASQSSRELAGEFRITVQARPGVDLDRLEAIVDEEIERLRQEPPTEREIQRALNDIEARMIRGMETVLGRADQLNSYNTYAGDPGYLDDDLARYRRVTRATLLEAVHRYLGDARIVLSVVPQGQMDLQAEAGVSDLEVAR